MEAENIELRNRELPPEEEDPAQEEETYLKISTSPSAGEKSKELYDNSELIINKRSGTINGLEFKGKKIIVKKNQFTKDRRLALNIEHFENILLDAEEEYENTASSVIEKETGLASTPLAEDVRENTSYELKERINNKKSEVENTLNDVKELLSLQEIREVNMDIQSIILNKNLPVDKKLELLEIEKEYWKKKRIESAAGPRRTFFESMQKLEEYEIDKLCIENDKKPRSEEGLELLREEARNNDLTRFEKFKRWAKENLFGLSTVAITIGGIITTVLVAGRSAIKQGASAFSKFANAVAKVAAKAGPLLSTLFGIISTALKMGAKGIMFLSNNLWILAVATAYAIAEYRRKSKKS